MKKILVIAGGGKKHLVPFAEEGKKMGLDVMIASFSDLNYVTENEFVLKVGDTPLDDFEIIYIRLVGKRFEDASLLVDYAKQKGIKVVDEAYEKSRFVRLPIAKSLEGKLLYEGGIPFPKTYYGSLENICDNAPKIFGYPFVIKGTQGKQGNAVWSPKDEEKLRKITEPLFEIEEKGGRFIAQEFIKASQRFRIFVIGDAAVAGITRPTRWRRRFIKKIGGKFPEGERRSLDPIPEEDAKIAVNACKALGINIAGVDVIHEDETGKPYILEVNSAPRWDSVSKDNGIVVEKEILKYLIFLH